MSSYEADHPSSAQPDAEGLQMSLDEILEELDASDGGLVLMDENGRRMMGDGVVEMLAGAFNTRSSRGATSSYISGLPSLRHKDIPEDGTFSDTLHDHCKTHPDPRNSLTLIEACGICQTPLRVLVDEEEHHLALDSPATAREALGVVRVGECGHHFCRRDASKWLTKSNACPLCRSACDPSRATADPASDSATPADAPSLPTAGAGQGQTPEQMMEMLQAMFGTGAAPEFAARQREEQDRDDFSGMYS